MTSHVYVRFRQSGGITREQWEAFCAEHQIAYAPNAAGRNVYYFEGRTGVECLFGDGTRGHGAEEAEPPDVAEHVQLSTFWGGPKQRDLARIGAAFWIRFGGSMYADEQTRRLICEREQART